MSQEQSTPPEEKKPGKGKETRPTDPANVSEAGGPLPELDEGPRPGPVDDIQEALFDAAQSGAPAEVDFETLPQPGQPGAEEPEEGAPEPGRDEVHQAAEQGTPADIAFDDLPEPVPDLDEGPRPGPVDDIQGALFNAARQGTNTELEFEALPEPGKSPTKKVVRFTRKPAPETKPATKVESDEEPVPLPTFPEESEAALAPAVTDFWLILTLFVSFRLLTLFLLRPGGFLRDWSDFDTYFGIASLSDYGLYPFLDFWLEWPPLLPWLAVGAYKLSLLLPPWPDDPRFWFILILGTVFVLFEVGNFVLVYRLARRLLPDPTTVTRVLWLYAGLFPPVYAMLGFFDGTALFFMLLALDFLLDERRIPSAVAVGVGFMVKIIPVLMLPVALRRIWRRHEPDRSEAGVEVSLYTVVFGLTVLALLLPFLIGGWQWVLASVRSIVGRSSWETIWAVLDGYYGFGQVGGDRLNPAETAFAIHGSAIPWWLITLLFGAVYAFVFTRRADYSRTRPVIAFAGLTVAIFLLYSKGYSPQFLVYLLPFIVLLFPNVRGLVYALTLTGLNVLEQPVYFVLLPQATWLLTFVVIARFLLIVVVALEFALVIWPEEEPLARLAKARRHAPLAVGGLALLALVILTPLMLQAYIRGRAVGSSLATFAGFMEAQANRSASDPDGDRMSHLLVSDQATYRQVYPYLRGEFEVRLVGGSNQYEGAPRIADVVQGLDRAWILPTGAQAQTLSSVASEQGQLVASFDFEELGAASLYSFRRAGVEPFTPLARFGGGIELLAHEAKVEQGAVGVALYWRVRSPQNQRLTVFTHLLDPDGQLVASHDSEPMNGAAPTTDWPVDNVRADFHRIELPPGLPAGEYTLTTGLYLFSDPNARLSGVAADGSPLPNQAVRLETVRLP